MINIFQTKNNTILFSKELSLNLKAFLNPLVNYQIDIMKNLEEKKIIYDHNI